MNIVDDITALPVPIVQTLLLIGAGLIGWFARRWIVGSGKREAVQALSDTLGVVEAMRRTGLTLEEARRITKELAGSGKTPTKETITALTEDESAPPAEPHAFHTTFGMIQRLEARLNVIRAEIDQALVDLRLALDEDGRNALDAAQEAWTQFSLAYANLEGSRWGQGSGRPVAKLAAMIARGEEWLAELRSQMDEPH